MPARILLDDTLNSYSRSELTLLLRMARELPSAVVLRAAHEHQPPSPLNIAADLRLVEQLSVMAVAGDQEALARNIARKLKALARASLPAFAGADPESRQTHPCPKCGRVMVPSYKYKRRQPSQWLCEVCDLGQEPIAEQLISNEAMNSALQGRSSHFRG